MRTTTLFRSVICATTLVIAGFVAACDRGPTAPSGGAVESPAFLSFRSEPGGGVDVRIASTVAVRVGAAYRRVIDAADQAGQVRVHVGAVIAK